MTTFYSEDIELLKEISKHKKIDIYLLHEKYMVSPLQLIRCLLKFKEINVVDFDNNEIRITPQGEKWIFNNRKVLFLTKRNENWKNVEKYQKKISANVNQSFTFKKNKISDDILKNI